MVVSRSGARIVDAWCPNPDTGRFVGRHGALREDQIRVSGRELSVESVETLASGLDLTEAEADVEQFLRERSREISGDAAEGVGCGLVAREVSQEGDRLVVESSYLVDPQWRGHVSRRWRMRDDGHLLHRRASYPLVVGKNIAISREERDVDRRVEAEMRAAGEDPSGWIAAQEARAQNASDPDAFSQFVGRCGITSDDALVRDWNAWKSGDLDVWEREGYEESTAAAARGVARV